MNDTCNGTIFMVPAPWGPGEGPNDQISLNFSYKVNFKYLKKKKIVCLLINERIKHIRWDFHSIA